MLWWSVLSWAPSLMPPAAILSCAAAWLPAGACGRPQAEVTHAAAGGTWRLGCAGPDLECVQAAVVQAVAKAACQQQDNDAAGGSAMQALAAIGSSFPELAFRHSLQVRSSVRLMLTPQMQVQLQPCTA